MAAGVVQPIHDQLVTSVRVIGVDVLVLLLALHLIPAKVEERAGGSSYQLVVTLNHGVLG